MTKFSHKMVQNVIFSNFIEHLQNVVSNWFNILGMSISKVILILHIWKSQLFLFFKNLNNQITT